MNIEEIGKLLEWSKAKRTRSVKIETKSRWRDDPWEVTAWVWDSELCVGQTVTSADEIDLRKHAVKQLEEETARLRKLTELPEGSEQ